MSEDMEQTHVKLETQKPIQRASTKFDEAPGEAEAETVRNEFLKKAGPSPSGAAATLQNTDGATRAGLLNRMQEDRGNTYVQRVVAEAHGAPGRLVGLSQPEMVGEVMRRKGGGSPLPEDTREQMEGHFGADLGGVQVHTGSDAVQLNRELNAQAFTVGSDIFFAEGKYAPSSSEGKGLLAHELTHVGQQTGFGAQNVQRKGAVDEDEEVKREAAPKEEEEENVQRAAAPEEEETNPAM
jgi:hypothetical protein